MPNWKDILNEVEEVLQRSNPYDTVRRQYLHNLHQKTRRNVVAYYSAWQQKPGAPGTAINDEDKHAFMTVFHQLDRSLGLDLILHTPGGDMAATESIVDYLRKMFGANIRAIVPHMAMSGGTMIACACKEVVMGKHSNLGPIDPQVGGYAAHGVLEEFLRAVIEVRRNPQDIPIWQALLSRYTPTLIGECEKAYEWAKETTKEWLKTGMFAGEPDADSKADRVVSGLADHAMTKSHARHLHAEWCKGLGMKIVDLEADQDLQEKVLSVHHAFMITLSQTQVVKIIENHRGVTFIKQIAPAHM